MKSYEAGWLRASLIFPICHIGHAMTRGGVRRHEPNFDISLIRDILPGSRDMPVRDRTAGGFLQYNIHSVSDSIFGASSMALLHKVLLSYDIAHGMWPRLISHQHLFIHSQRTVLRFICIEARFLSGLSIDSRIPTLRAEE